MKVLIPALVGFVLAYLDVSFFGAMFAVILVGAAMYIAFPSKKRRHSREDRAWAQSDPMGHWLSHKK